MQIRQLELELEKDIKKYAQLFGMAKRIKDIDINITLNFTEEKKLPTKVITNCDILSVGVINPANKMLSIIKEHKIISKSDLINKTRFLKKNRRDEILEDLFINGNITAFKVVKKTKPIVQIKYLK